MPRPTGGNLNTRLRAYELWVAGTSKTAIAREIGRTKACISQWAKADNWDHRLANVTREAEIAVDHTLGDQIAQVVGHLRGRLQQRIAELERLCSSAEKPATRLAAIQLWFRLADVKQAIPNPVTPETGRNLELIQDLVIDASPGPQSP